MANEVVESQAAVGQEEAQQGGSRSKLVQRLLTAGPNLPAFVTDLVTAQAVTVVGTEAAGFLMEKTADDVVLRPIAHVRPDTATAETRSAAITAFQEIIKPCIEQGKDGAIEINGAEVGGMEPQFCLVTLLRADGEIVAASAVITRCMNLERARQRLMSMQLVAGYFELFSLRRNSEQARIIAQSHQHVLQLATAVAVADGFEAAARNLCNELATRTNAVRVSVGWLKGRTIKVQALSHTEQFDKKQELIVQLQNTMEECLDQEEAVQFDPTGEGSSPNVSRAAQVLSRSQGGNIVLSLPLRKGEDVAGVVTLEFPPNQPLGPNVVSGLAVAVDLLAPQLHDRYVNDRWLITKAGLSTKDVAEKAIGPKYMIAKLVIVAVIVLGCFVTFYKPMYHVNADFQFVAQRKMSAQAPFDGTLDLSKDFKKPGDPVKTGDILFAMRIDTGLQDQLNDARAQAAKAQTTANAYHADRTKQAEYAEAMAEYESQKAKVALFQGRIDRAVVKSTVDGYVLKGDLRGRDGAAVRQEDVLMEVGPIANLDIELHVPERDIQLVHTGQKGALATATFPGDSYGFTVGQIVPMGVPKDGGNYLTVYATADKAAGSWRPGMVGEAKIDIEKKPLVWIWTHRLNEFIQMKLWQWR